MSDSESLLSPSAMRAMAIKLLERAAEVEQETRKRKASTNVIPLENNSRQPRQGRNLSSEYPLHALATLAKGIYDQRQKRNTLFEYDFSREAAWDILLDLYIQRTAGKRVQTSSACIASNVPQSTALRHIALLEEAGLVRRMPDPMDSRVVYVEITRHAYEKMAEHLNDVHSSFSNASAVARESFSIVN